MSAVAMRLDGQGADPVVAVGPQRGKRMRAMPGAELERCLAWTQEERGRRAQGVLPGLVLPGGEALKAQAEALVAEKQRRWWAFFGPRGGGR